MGKLESYDVFHSRYYKGATYSGNFEMPVIEGTDEVPRGVIRFSDSRSRKRDDSEAWVVPYEHDIKIERVWRNAFRYMDGLLEHPGIVSWDFSMYRVMPFALQYWNCFRGRLIGSLYERCGGKCIPNIRPSDPRSYKYVFDGLPTDATVAMGTVGNLRDSMDRRVFRSCVAETVRRLRPKNIVVYGDAPEGIFSPAFDAGVNVISFATRTQQAHEEGD
ncbi:MAG: DUF4417 domain-containing protein [Denitrobacterium sp.]|jgi:hypothetical protein|nr:DUF4417 domain-containing protein [Denitrobacterium sp.]